MRQFIDTQQKTSFITHKIVSMAGADDKWSRRKYLIIHKLNDPWKTAVKTVDALRWCEAPGNGISHILQWKHAGLWALGCVLAGGWEALSSTDLLCSAEGQRILVSHLRGGNKRRIFPLPSASHLCHKLTMEEGGLAPLVFYFVPWFSSVSPLAQAHQAFITFQMSWSRMWFHTGLCCQAEVSPCLPFNPWTVGLIVFKAAQTTEKKHSCSISSEIIC